MARALEIDDQHDFYRSSSIYPNSSVTDTGLQFDFDFGFDPDPEKNLKGSSSTSSQENDVPSPSTGSETVLQTPRRSTGGRSEKSLGEQYIIFWDGPYDPANPQHWPAWRKWTAVMIVSGITFVT